MLFIGSNISNSSLSRNTEFLRNFIRFKELIVAGVILKFRFTPFIFLLSISGNEECSHLDIRNLRFPIGTYANFNATLAPIATFLFWVSSIIVMYCVILKQLKGKIKVLGAHVFTI